MPAASQLTAELRAFPAAVSFLTRVPIGRWIALDGDDVARGAPLFPLVGAGIGAAVGGTAAGLSGTLSPLLAAALALAAGALLTGALHLDALTDTADALGAHTKERALAIMRDHAIGAYGATALTLDLLIKAACLATLARQDRALAITVAAVAASRAVPVVLAATLPYARAEGGTGASITDTSKTRAALAAALALAIAAATAGRTGIATALAVIITVPPLALAFARWLGGITGDALGASAELAELAALVVAVGLVGAG